MNRYGDSNLLWRWVRPGGDLAVGLAAFYAAFLIRIHLPLPFTQFLLPPDRIGYFFGEWWVALVSLLAALYFFGLYEPPPERPKMERSRRLLACLTTLGVGLAGFYFLTNREFPRSVLLLFVALAYLLLLTWRGVLARLYRPPRRRIAIVGAGTAAQELRAKIVGAAGLGLELAGWVPDPDAAPVAPTDLGPCLGTVDDLPDLVLAGSVDEVIVATSSRPWQTRLLEGLSKHRPAGGPLLLVPGPIESLIGKMRYRWVEDVPLIEVARPRGWGGHLPAKRVADLILGGGLFLLTLPLLICAALAVRLTSPGPAFYRQARVGKDRRTFTLWKLRTMTQDAEDGVGEVLAQKDDPRLTSLGRFLRRYRLDELPQLLNVLDGTMSLVGPRPERPGFVERYLDEVPGYGERFLALPGLTGLAQVNGGYHSTPANKLRYDLAYVANWSLWLDLAILFRTVKIVLTSRGV